MNQDEFGGIVRAIVAGVGGFAVGKGWIDNATLTAIAGGLATVAVAIWSVIVKRRAAK